MFCGMSGRMPGSRSGPALQNREHVPPRSAKIRIQILDERLPLPEVP